MDRTAMIEQLELWTRYVTEEAIILFDKGVGAQHLMATAVTIADARLSSEMAQRRGAGLTLPEGLSRYRRQ